MYFWSELLSQKSKGPMERFVILLLHVTAQKILQRSDLGGGLPHSLANMSLEMWQEPLVIAQTFQNSPPTPDWGAVGLEYRSI